MLITSIKKMPKDSTGPFVTAVLTGTILSFDEYPEQEFDLAALQTGKPKHIRFSIDRDDVISTDVLENYWLIAEIDIPGRSYISEPVLDAEENPVLDENDNPKTITVVKPIEINEINLTAWQLPAGTGKE